MNKAVLLIFLSISILFFSCKEEKEKRKDLSQYDNTLIEINKYLIKEDNERIKSYINRKGWDMQQSETGMWYEIYEKAENGDTTSAKSGDFATINFTVELLDGTICYTSDSLGVKKFKISYSDVESGLNQAIKMMHIGDKARFIMPPYIAHGLVGDEYKIPGRATIVYHVELLEIQSK